MTVEFDPGQVDLIALQFRFIPPLNMNRSCTETQLQFINQFVVVQWKPARCRIHLRPVMVRYGLAKLLRGVKALQTRKKSANGFENLLLHGLASHSER